MLKINAKNEIAQFLETIPQKNGFFKILIQ